MSEPKAVEVKPSVASNTGSRGNNNESKKVFFNKKYINTRSGRFEGRIEELKGHVYDYGEYRSANQFVNTTKEIRNYVSRTIKNSGDIYAAMATLSGPLMVEPVEPKDQEDKVAYKKWERAFDKYNKKLDRWEENSVTLYNIVWGQCSETMQQKLASTVPNFKSIDGDGIKLLIALKDTSYSYESQKFRVEAIAEALYRVMTFRQGQLSPYDYYEQFTNLLAVYIHCGGSCEPDPGVLECVATDNNWDMKTITDEQKGVA
jgi:hypothetical protein